MKIVRAKGENKKNRRFFTGDKKTDYNFESFLKHF
jgi:hypothetical protein